MVKTADYPAFESGELGAFEYSTQRTKFKKIEEDFEKKRTEKSEKRVKFVQDQEETVALSNAVV